jgi:hypothetical protein
MHDLHAYPNKHLAWFYGAFIRDTLTREYGIMDKGGVKVRGSMLFYPLDGRPGDERELARIFAAGFAEARTYQVTADMVDAVDGMYGTTADKKVRHLDEGDVLSPIGFCWLDKPWVNRDVRGKDVSVRAVLWQPQLVRWSYGREAQDEPPPTPTAGLRVSLFSMRGDPDDYEFDGPEQLIDDALNHLGPLVLLHSFVWPFEARFGGEAGAGVRITSDDPLQWLHCMWMLLDSEIVTSRTEQADRQTRKRVTRSLKDAEVTVVTLRRAKSVAPEDWDEHLRQIDWTCRWLVQGHWRHLGSYLSAHHHAMVSGRGDGTCATCGERITWVKPHLKGPEDRPLRLTEKVYRLSR